MSKTLQQLIAIVGPTASGKSDLAVNLALQIGGEVISADSRQVYRGLDIGSGKITQDEMRHIPHHLLDVTDPLEYYSVSQYRTLASKIISEIDNRRKSIIICGGTAQYVNSLIYDIRIPDVPPDEILRQKLASMSKEELFIKLTNLDPRRAQNIESKNPRRLIRAIEIIEAIGKIPPQSTSISSRANAIICLNPPKEELQERIKVRLRKRIEIGMIEEVKHLREDVGLSWKRLDDLGLDYRYLAKHLRGELTEGEMVRELEIKIWQYARRQMTWWKRDPNVHFVWHTDPKCLLQQTFQIIGV